MKAIIVPSAGGPEVLAVAEVADPVPGHGEVLIAVAAAGVNRADIAQRAGLYPPPHGASPLLGLEVSGTIIEIGAGVSGWVVGDRVCALLPGGGYASLAVASAGTLLPVPDGLALEDAAALPEVIATVWSNVVMLAGLRAGETVLVHGGSSGIGTMAIQLARTLGCLVAVTAGSAQKLLACEGLGAEILVNYREEDFVERVLDATDRRGVDVILDAVGGGYFDRNLRSLAPHGRLVIIGNQSGTQGVADIRLITSKWLTVHGSVLRARPQHEKDDIIASVHANAWPLVESGQIVPVIFKRFPFEDARLAHELMESSAHIGKVLLIP